MNVKFAIIKAILPEISYVQMSCEVASSLIIDNSDIMCALWGFCDQDDASIILFQNVTHSIFIYLQEVFF